MSKTLVVGDIHLKAFDMLAKVDDVLSDDGTIERVVFLGDVCDEWGSDDGQMMREIEEFADWVEDRRASGMRVDVLLGNHDFQYLLGVAGPGTHMGLMRFVSETLFQLGPQAACEVDGFLLTHAGLTRWFADEHLDDPQSAAEAAEQLNDLYEDGSARALEAIFSRGMVRGGCDAPGPLWADKCELEEDPVDDIPQIVGHTPVATACRGEMRELGESAPEIWFCDTFSLQSDMTPIGDGSMLIVEDGNVEAVHPA